VSQGWQDVVLDLWLLILPSPNSPSLTAVLWDVTDAEIDKVAQSTSSQLRMDESHVAGIGENSTGLDDMAVSNVQALSKARDCCKLKYLTGAAPVTYGVPFYFR
jgi:separase